MSGNLGWGRGGWREGQVGRGEGGRQGGGSGQDKRSWSMGHIGWNRACYSEACSSYC
jgi:hypothetical protein